MPRSAVKSPRGIPAAGGKAAWNEFQSSHAVWWELRSSSGDPVYRLTEHVLDELCDSRPARTPGSHRRRRLLTTEEERGERAFLGYCRPLGLVGVTACGAPIQYPFLDTALGAWRPGRKLPRADLDIHFHDAHQILLAARQSQMVHAAWLVQQPGYWNGINAIRTQWAKVRRRVSFDEICGRHVPLASLATNGLANVNDPQVQQLHADVWHLARRWRIACWLTWHFPIPEGLLTGVPASMLQDFRGRDDVDAAVPDFMPIARVIGEGKVIWRQPISSLPGGHIRLKSDGSGPVCLQNQVKAQGLLLQVYISELAVRQRFGSTLPRGLSGRLNAGIAQELGWDEDHVKRQRRRLRSAF